MAGPGLSDAERRVTSRIDRDALVEDVRALVRIPSWNGNEGPAQEHMAGLMAGAGLDVDLWTIDLAEVSRHPHASFEIDRTDALGLVGTLKGSGDGPTLVLNGHVDVVPPGDLSAWSHGPFDAAVVDGRIVGRGALDMKGPLVAGLHALAAVRAAGHELAGSVHLHSVIGEEDGGIGTLATVLRGYTGDGAVVLEPTESAVCPAQAGCLNFRVRVPGAAAHGAVRDEGVSAIEKLFPVFAAIQALEAERNEGHGADALFGALGIPFPISVGTIRGGDWASSVPDWVEFEGRMGVVPGEEFDAARTALQRAVSAAADRDGFLRDRRPVVEWWGGRFLPARTPLDSPIVAAVTEAHRDQQGDPPAIRGVPFGADMGLLSRVGQTPTVLYGTGDIRDAHRPDESVGIDDLVQMAETLAVLVMRFCSGESGRG